MTINEEPERAVERLEKYLAERKKAGQLDPIDIHALHMGDEREAVLTVTDLRAILSERAELLATVERMRGALELFAAVCDDEVRADDADTSKLTVRVRLLRQARAALTTGEGK